MIVERVQVSKFWCVVSDITRRHCAYSTCIQDMMMSTCEHGPQAGSAQRDVWWATKYNCRDPISRVFRQFLLTQHYSWLDAHHTKPPQKNRKKGCGGAAGANKRGKGGNKNHLPKSRAYSGPNGPLRGVVNDTCQRRDATWLRWWVGARHLAERNWARGQRTGGNRAFGTAVRFLWYRV